MNTPSFVFEDLLQLSCYFVCVHFHAVSGYPACLAVYRSPRHTRQSALQYTHSLTLVSLYFPLPSLFNNPLFHCTNVHNFYHWHVYILWLGYPLKWPCPTTLTVKLCWSIKVMTSQRDKIMRIRPRAIRYMINEYCIQCSYLWRHYTHAHPSTSRRVGDTITTRD